MILFWLKSLHISGLVIWVAGLLYLPAILASHNKVGDRQDYARIRMSSRFLYLGLVSPAAFVSVAAGTALLFVSDTLHPWMFLKLVAVGILVIAHLQCGSVLAHLGEEEARVPRLRLAVAAAAVPLSSLAILVLVLAKPEVPTAFMPRALTEPGVLTRPETAPPVPDPARRP